MAFDPDKFLKKYETQTAPSKEKEEKPRRKAFDPDEFLREKKSVVESAARGAAQGASFGFADEITGALEAAKDVALTDKELGDLVDQYKKRRDESRKEYDMAEKDNSGAYMAGNVAGGVATAFIPGVGLAGNLGKGASLGAKVAQGAKLGAMEGAAFGLGESRADLTEGDVGGVLKDTATGAAVGGALGGALPAVGHGAKKVLDGAPARKVTKVGANIITDMPHQYTDIILDNPKLNREPVSLMSIQDDIASSANNLQKSIADADKIAWETLGSQRVFDARDLDAVVDDVLIDNKIMREGKFGDAAYSHMGQDKSALRKAQEVKNELANLEMHSQKDLKYIIQKIDAETDWDKPELDQANRVLQQVRHRLDDILKGSNPRYKEAMGHVAPQVKHLDDVKREFRLKRNGEGGFQPTDTTLSRLRNLTNAAGDAKRLQAFDTLEGLSSYRIGSNVSGQTNKEGVEAILDAKSFTKDLEIAKMLGATETGVTNGSRNVKLGEILLGGVGSALTGGLMGGPIGGLYGAVLGASAGVVRDKYGRKIGRNVVAKMANGVNAFDYYAAKLANMPAKYKRALEAAARRGVESLAITHEYLSQNDPEYKKVMED